MSAVAATILQRYVQKDSKLHPLGYIVLPCAIATVLLLVLALIRGYDTRWELLPKFNLLLLAVVWPIANLLYVSAMRRVEASQFSVIFTTRVLWVIIASAIFLNERLPLAAVVGALFLFASSVLALWEEGISYRHIGILYVLLNAMLAGLGVTNDGVILSRGYDVISYFVIGFAVTPLVFWIISPNARSSSFSIIRDRKLFLQATTLAILYAISAVTLFYAFQKGRELSILSSLNQIQTILIVLGAAILLKERRYLTRRLIAAIISFIGVLLVINTQ